MLVSLLGMSLKWFGSDWYPWFPLMFKKFIQYSQWLICYTKNYQFWYACGNPLQWIHDNFLANFTLYLCIKDIQEYLQKKMLDHNNSNKELKTEMCLFDSVKVATHRLKTVQNYIKIAIIFKGCTILLHKYYIIPSTFRNIVMDLKILWFKWRALPLIWSLPDSVEHLWDL